MNAKRIERLPALPPRSPDAHKGTFGTVLIIGGSRGMAGAVALGGMAALRSGAGLTRIACPHEILATVAGFEPSYLTLPLPEDRDGRIAAAARPVIEAHLSGVTAVAVGPGLGQSDELRELITDLYRHLPLPLVVDADALNLLASLPQGCPAVSADRARVLTPHPGEFARLSKLTTSQVQADREKCVLDLAQQLGAVVLLKGARSLISDGKQLGVNTTGNNGMATGGTGDVLTGLIAALLAQGMHPFDAAYLGAHLHGLAGDLAADALSRPGLIASDLPDYLCAAWKQLGQ